MDKSLQLEKTYTILELNSTVRRLLKQEFTQAIWVCGEIQDFRSSRDKRHIYFSLVQKHSQNNEIAAKVGAAIFEGRKAAIYRRLQQAQVQFELKNDIEVRVQVEVDLYPKSGNFNLIVVGIDPVYTLGKIAQTRQKIIEELRKKGLLQRNKLCTLPVIPLRIGLITAHNSAAISPFI